MQWTILLLERVLAINLNCLIVSDIDLLFCVKKVLNRNYKIIPIGQMSFWVHLIVVVLDRYVYRHFDRSTVQRQTPACRSGKANRYSESSLRRKAVDEPRPFDDRPLVIHRSII